MWFDGIRQPNTQYVLSLSYGKDSMACIHVIKDVLNWPLDRIVTADIWATKTIPADPPNVVEFKGRADEIIRSRYGIEVEHYTTNRAEGITGYRVSYEECFYRVMSSGKFAGRIKGFPMVKGNWCTKLKLNALEQIAKATSGGIQYLGIAADEPKRIARHIDRTGIKLPLVEAGWDEDMCGLWCKYSGLLSPVYESGTRGGCWFCHNQGVEQLRYLRKMYPEYWQLLMKWDNDSPVKFHADGHTVHDFDRRFSLEEEGLIHSDEKFRWSMLENQQLRLF